MNFSDLSTYHLRNYLVLHAPKCYDVTRVTMGDLIKAILHTQGKEFTSSNVYCLLRESQ